MYPLDYTSPDALLHVWAPPASVVRSLGPHITITRPFLTRVPEPGAEGLTCTGRLRTHLPTPHAESCPLDYTHLFVALHRRQKEKLLQAHANRPIPLLSRHHTATLAAASPTPSQNSGAAVARAARVSGGGTVVERAVPASVAAVMADIAATTTTAAAAPPPRVSFSSPHHHHHHHHHPQQQQQHRPSAETRAPSTQQSPVMPQHHHHHYQQQQQQRQPSTEMAAVHAAETLQQQQQQQRMRYRVGRSGSTQLLPLAISNGEATGVGAAGMVAAAAAAAGATFASVRRSVSSNHHHHHQRRSTSPLSYLPSSGATSVPREASVTPLSLALSSIRRSVTRESETGLAQGPRFTTVAAVRHATSPRVEQGESDNGEAMAAAGEKEEDVVPAHVLADARMFLRAPHQTLRSSGAFTADDAVAAVVSSQYCLTTTTTTSGEAEAAAGDALSTEQQRRDLQLHLQRALRRQRRLKYLMFHDGDEDAATAALSGGDADSGCGGGSLEEDGEEEEEEETDGSSGHMWHKEEDGDDAAAAEPLWRSSPSSLADSLLPPPPPPPPSVLSITPRCMAESPPVRLASVHPHQHISLHRFHDPSEDAVHGEGVTLGIRADSVSGGGGGRRGWSAVVVGRGRSSTTSPSPQPEPSRTRGQQQQHHQPSEPTIAAEVSPAPALVAHHHHQHTPLATANPINSSAARTTAAAMTATRSAAVAPSSTDRSGTIQTEGTRTPTSVALVLHGASSLSSASRSLPRQRGAAQERAHNGSSGDGDLSPPLLSPISAGLAPRLSLPSAALVDVAMGGVGVDGWSFAARPSIQQDEDSVSDGNVEVSCLAETQAVVRVSGDATDFVSPHHVRSALAALVPHTGDIAHHCVYEGTRGGSSRRGWADRVHSSSPSPSQSNDCHFHSLAAHRVALHDATQPSTEAVDTATTEDTNGKGGEMPRVRRTSPGLSGGTSSKCTRFSAPEDCSCSGASFASVAEEEEEGGVMGGAALIRSGQPRTAVSTSPPPPHDTPDARALVEARVARAGQDNPPRRVTTPAAAVVPSALFLSDMLRLSFSPDDDKDDEADSAGALRAEHAACTPPRAAEYARYPLCSPSSGARGGVAGTASISSSPPSPHRTAMRHDMSSFTDETAAKDGPLRSGAVHVSPLRHRCTTTTAGTPTMLPPTLMSSPMAAAVASRLALSSEEGRLHASTASTAVGGENVFGAPPRFSDASSLSRTTNTNADVRRASSVLSTPTPISEVFSAPAEIRLQSLLQASAWAAASTLLPPRDSGDEEEREVERGSQMRTPPRYAGSQSGARASPSGSSCSAATPYHCGGDGRGSVPGSPLVFTAAGTRAPASVLAVPHTHTLSTATAVAAVSMPPPQSSPFRGSGSFLRVPPCWAGSGASVTAGAAAGAEEGRPSDGFGADTQLLARMTCMALSGNGDGGSATGMSTLFSSSQGPSQQQQQVPSPSSSPGRISRNSLNFFVAAATPQDGAGGGEEEGPGTIRSGSGSGLYGSAVAHRRSWAPRKGRGDANRRRRGSHRRRRRTRASASGDPYRLLQLTPDLTSPLPRGRWSRGDGESSGRRSYSGVFLPPQRLTFGSALASVAATHVTATTAEGMSDSGERWGSTAMSTPTATALLHQQQQQQQQRRHANASPLSYREALRAQSSGEQDGLRSPSLRSMAVEEATTTYLQPRASWLQASSPSPSTTRRTPSGRLSLSSSEVLRAPRRQQRRRQESHRGSWTPAASALPSYSSLWSSGVVDTGNPAPPQRRSLSASGASSEDQIHPRHRVSCVVGDAPRRGPCVTSPSALRSPSAVGTRLTWGTAEASLSTSLAAAGGSRERGSFSLSPVRSPRQRSPCGGNNANATPLRASWSQRSGAGIGRLSAAAGGPSGSSLGHTGGAATGSGGSSGGGGGGVPLTLADELRSFGGPSFAARPLPSSFAGAMAPPSRPSTTAGGPSTAVTTFLASPPRRASNGGGGTMAIPPELQALRMRGIVTGGGGGGGASSSSSPIKPTRQRGCSERREVNVEPGAAYGSHSP